MATIKAVAVVEGIKVDGGAPIFYAKNETELQQLAFNLEKILDVNAHVLKPGTFILVDHKG
ncbi:capping complex subunit for YIEGIA [Paenibacillus chitinolyticus]|uniref:capping complex subunit for YIEGIA n=1 Tax=Paenibacillus chitinolyticus TaxID=79263 RepID=UPI00364756AB